MLQAHLHFQVEGTLGSSHILFPRVVDQLVAVTNITEFHLALTQGRWVSRMLQSVRCCTTSGTHCHTRSTCGIVKYIIHASGSQHATRWGRAIVPALPAGAQLRAQFQQGSSQEVRLRTMKSSGSRIA